MKLGKQLWLEDDATTRDPDHEGLYEAWLRLFGEKLNTATATEVEDLGDATLYRMPNGKVACASCAGNNSIHDAGDAT